ncbi:MAG: hypothetical protein M5U01_20665 [Ardenticatenaceae bacterium]|nr:hypothetical protein [Ardenticatenaceae bacterium]HBY92901.1 hypothetical protein [Chloroflexota bacterium]
MSLSKPSQVSLNDPARFGLVLFTGTLLIQLFHEAEHVFQFLQKYHWHWQSYPGLLGQWFDFEWVHFLYNAALAIALLATWVTHRRNPGIWRASGLGSAALTFLVVFQAYHWFEHLIRLIQYINHVPTPPGLLGQIFPQLELHFWLNGVVTVTMLVAYGLFLPWRIRPPKPETAQLCVVLDSGH